MNQEAGTADRPMLDERLSANATVARVSILLMLTIFLVFGLTWMFDLETSLADVRQPRTDGSSDALPGQELLAPGYHEISGVNAQIEGEWLMQEIGESDWLATDQEGGRIRAAFYGTDIYLVARIGPEAGRAYVSINNRPAELRLVDEQGAYINLWGFQAADQPILLATGLAHGEHLIEITAAGDGEIAIAGFDVIAQTPFPWAFVLGYTGLAGGLFLVLRQLFYTLSRRRAPLIPGIPSVARGLL